MSQRTPVDLKALAQLDGVVLRLVEQQGAQATRRTTDNLDEQAWLEDFLEASKPELPSAEECAVPPLPAKLSALSDLSIRGPNDER